MPKDERLDMAYYQRLEPFFHYANEVSLYGLGEPLIDKDYFEKVNYITSFGADVSLSTNGTLMSEERCRKLIESGIRAVGISLDASTAETYETVRPPGGFERVMQNIQTLTRIKEELSSPHPRLILSFGIMRQNIEDVEAFPDLAHRLGADEVVIHPVTYQSARQKEELAVAWEDLVAVVEKARKKTQDYGISFYFWDIDPNCYLNSLAYVRRWEAGDVNPSHEGNAEKKYCSFLWRNAMIQGKGEVFPCCYITNIRLGWLDEAPLSVLRGHPFLQDLKEQLSLGNPPKVCASCPQLLPYRRKEILKRGWHELKQIWISDK